MEFTEKWEVNGGRLRKQTISNSISYCDSVNGKHHFFYTLLCRSVIYAERQLMGDLSHQYSPFLCQVLPVCAGAGAAVPQWRWCDGGPCGSLPGAAPQVPPDGWHGTSWVLADRACLLCVRPGQHPSGGGTWITWIGGAVWGGGGGGGRWEWGWMSSLQFVWAFAMKSHVGVKQKHKKEINFVILMQQALKADAIFIKY